MHHNNTDLSGIICIPFELYEYHYYLRKGFCKYKVPSVFVKHECLCTDLINNKGKRYMFRNKDTHEVDLQSCYNILI